MARPRECSHAERYKDGRCKPCTRVKQAAYQREYRRWKRLERKRLQGPPALTMEDLIGAPKHDLL